MIDVAERGAVPGLRQAAHRVDPEAVCGRLGNVGQAT